MKDVRLTWELPVTRESGFPLNPADIAHVEVALSADGGANFGVLGTVAPGSTQTFTQTELEIGTWFFRLVVVDVAGLRSQPVQVQADVPDETAPDAVANVIVSII